MEITKKATIDDALGEVLRFDFILSEGRKGNHLLFEDKVIQSALALDHQSLLKRFESRIEEMNVIINELFAIKGLDEKKEYISSLSREVQGALVFGYFQLLDAEINGESPERSIH